MVDEPVGLFAARVCCHLPSTRPPFDQTALVIPFPMRHTLAYGTTRAADLHLWSPAVSLSRHPAQLLGLLVLRQGCGCAADAQARSGAAV